MTDQLTDFEAVLDAIETLLGTIAPTRLVTRDLKDWDKHPKADRADGVFTILPGPRDSYDYEYRPGDLPRVQIFIYGENQLARDVSGREIDAEENAMARELETLANQAPEQDLLAELALDSITPSAQTMKPTASILGVFIFGVDR